MCLLADQQTVAVTGFRVARPQLVFQSAMCGKCSRVIRGSSYQCIQSCKMTGVSLFNPYMICEPCFLYKKTTCPGKHALRKSYKHSILPEVINPQVTEKLCSCKISGISWATKGAYSFPVDKNDKHTGKCGLLLLRQSIIRARKGSLRDILQPKQKGIKLTKKKREKIGQPYKDTLSVSSLGSLLSLCDSEEDLKGDVKEDEIDDMLEDIRNSEKARNEFLQVLEKSEAQTRQALPSIGGRRRFLETIKTYPFGNVHMSLMVGPIIFENGAQAE
jgi:hypothetical protein